MRERAIKFLSTKLKTLPEDVMTKEVEEYVFTETKKVGDVLCSTIRWLAFPHPFMHILGYHIGKE